MARAPNYELAEKDYMEGMKYKDIADKYDVSINTVKSWKQRYNWNKKGVHTNSKKVCTQNNKVENINKPIAKEVKQVLDNPELTDKQRLFCLYYSKSFNATQSYLKAYGCSYETAMVEGSNSLRNPKVKEEIMHLKELKLQQIVVGEEDMVEMHMRIAFADIGDYVSFGREEVTVMSMFGPVKDEEGNELKKVINTVKLKESNKVDTQLIKEIKQGKDGVSIKLLDRCKSLDWLDKYFLMNPMDKHKIEYDNKMLKLNIAKAQLNDEEGNTEDDGFIEALSGKVDEIWQE